ncbi:hypothetical protein HYFRA_00005291 [Hymenoscyphus fraxineus]|uniref:Uncharacterized protein n=1 Tax=Hymenoscyphus fraxineus TaxID=746836 RepID=A0A9N9LCY7_9HELO|nr:hypothetical protein HYFRA_00005291 [Hymenoscyphus fraxineus]
MGSCSQKRTYFDPTCVAFVVRLFGLTSEGDFWILAVVLFKDSFGDPLDKEEMVGAACLACLSWSGKDGFFDGFIGFCRAGDGNVPILLRLILPERIDFETVQLELFAHKGTLISKDEAPDALSAGFRLMMVARTFGMKMGRCL